MDRLRPVQLTVAAACAWEAAALLSGRLPTISELQARHRVVGAVAVAWLIIHFARYQGREPCAEH